MGDWTVYITIAYIGQKRDVWHPKSFQGCIGSLMDSLSMGIGQKGLCNDFYISEIDEVLFDTS